MPCSGQKGSEMLFDLLGIAIVLVIIFLLVFPTGRYMATVFAGGRTWLNTHMDPVDNAIYRLAGVNPQQAMRWWPYCLAMLVTNLVMFLIQFVILEIQQVLPLNPDRMGPIDPFLAFNTAASFITNTNWQNYGGENTLSYFSQMFAIIFPQFTSAATGLAAGVAFIRGLGGSTDLGNFYVDLTRSITRIMLPISLAAAVVLVGLGVPQTFSGALTVSTLNGPPGQNQGTLSQVSPGHPTPDLGDLGGISPKPPVEPTATPAPSETSQGKQTITRGLAASLVAIKHLGTNGGGWFNANSAHPFENPTPITNVLEILLMALIPTSIIYTLGIM